MIKIESHAPSLNFEMTTTMSTTNVAIAPILLGRGIDLWDDLRGFEDGYQVQAETAESSTVHVTFARTRRDARK